MNIYKVNDCDWYAAETAEEALGELGRQCGQEMVDEANEFGVCQLTPEEMEMLVYVDEEVSPPVRRSFAAQLRKEISEGAKFPMLFATTEF